MDPKYQSEFESFISANPQVVTAIDSILSDDKLFSSLQTEVGSPFITPESLYSQNTSDCDGQDKSLYSQNTPYDGSQDFTSTVVVDTVSPVEVSTYITLTSPGTGMSVDAGHVSSKYLSAYSSPSPYSQDPQYPSSPLCDNSSSLDTMSLPSHSSYDVESSSTNFSSDGHNLDNNPDLVIEQQGSYTSSPDSSCSSYCSSSPSQDNNHSPFSSAASPVPSVTDHVSSNIIPRHPRGDKRCRNVSQDMITKEEQSIIPRHPCGNKRRKVISHDTLTREERNKRVKQINNDSSKRYRQRKTNTIQQMKQEEQVLLARQAELKPKFEDLVRQKDKMQSLIKALRNRVPAGNCKQQQRLYIQTDCST